MTGILLDKPMVHKQNANTIQYGFRGMSTLRHSQQKATAMYEECTRNGLVYSSHVLPQQRVAMMASELEGSSSSCSVILGGEAYGKVVCHCGVDNNGFTLLRWLQYRLPLINIEISATFCLDLMSFLGSAMPLPCREFEKAVQPPNPIDRSKPSLSHKSVQLIRLSWCYGGSP